MLAIITKKQKALEKYRPTIIAAALSMNISMLDQQNEMNSQEIPLTFEQRQLINRHPLDSANILRKLQITNTLWLSLVEMHHETGTASGYPHRLPKQKILPHARLIHMADVACASLSSRSYRQGMHATAAMRLIYQNEKNEFDDDLIYNLIRTVGIYPPGCLVHLNSNEIGIVWKTGQEPIKPIVATICHNGGPIYAEPLIRETARTQFKIKNAIHNDAVKVHFTYYSKLWQI